MQSKDELAECREACEAWYGAPMFDQDGAAFTLETHIAWTAWQARGEYEAARTPHATAAGIVTLVDRVRALEAALAGLLPAAEFASRESSPPNRYDPAIDAARAALDGKAAALARASDQGWQPIDPWKLHHAMQAAIASRGQCATIPQHTRKEQSNGQAD